MNREPVERYNPFDLSPEPVERSSPFALSLSKGLQGPMIKAPNQGDLMSFWVYILRCSDRSYYTGHTENLENRIAQHLTGAIPSCYTYNRRPLEYVFSQEFTTREEALTSERQIKGWSRKKKEAMIRGDWTEVSRLARSTAASSLDSGRVKSTDRRPSTVRQAHSSGQTD